MQMDCIIDLSTHLILFMYIQKTLKEIWRRNEERQTSQLPSAYYIVCSVLPTLIYRLASINPDITRQATMSAQLQPDYSKRSKENVLFVRIHTVQ